MDIEKVAQIVREVAREEILPRWRTLERDQISQKSSRLRDVVTIADQAAEAALTRRLTALVPGSRLVGEETFAATPDCLSGLYAAEPVWIVDPVDGTYAFAHGEPEFAVMVALAEAGELLAAWIHEPVDDAMTLGERGAGVEQITADGTRRPSAPVRERPPAELVGILSGGIADLVATAPRFRALREMSCPGRDYPSVLRGDADFAAYSRCLPWDHLPGAMLLAEAGHFFARLDGTPYRVGDTAGGVMSAPGRDSWEQIRAALGVGGA